MKKFYILLSIIVFPSLSFASQKPRLDELMFKPIKGQLVSISTISEEQQKFKQINNFVQYEDQKVTDLNIEEILDYGITNKLNFFALFQYSEEETTNQTTKVTSKIRGIENPIFALKYRLLNQIENLIDLDVMLPVSFDVIESETADSTTNKIGTVADGRDMIATRFDLGKYIGNLGVNLGFGVTYNAKKESRNSNGSLATATSSVDTAYGIETQYRFPVGSINLNATRINTGAYKDELSRKFVIDKTESYFVTLNLSHKPRKYIASIQLKRTNVGDVKMSNTVITRSGIKYRTLLTSFKYSF